MKILMCVLCDGELDLINPFDFGSVKKVKCRRCGFNSSNKSEKWEREDKKNKVPEVVIRRIK